MYKFIQTQKGHYPVEVQCRVLKVSRSSYYAWRSGITYGINSQDKQKEQAVIKSFQTHRRRYGVRRLVPELREQGMLVGPYRVRKILRKHGLKAIQPRSFVPKTTDSRHPYFISPNLLMDRFTIHGLNEVWVGDITYLPLEDGQWAYLCTWMDLYSRRIVGWAIELHMEESLVINALKRALGTRNVPHEMIIHSDRGGQYAGNAFRLLLDKYHLRQSMSRADNPYDNAFMESYFSRFKAELLENGEFENVEDARTETFEYIEMYYNPIRRHSSLNYISPDKYEKISNFV